MKAPNQYDLKKWLCDNTIIGLRLHYYQTGTDTAETDWELMPETGKAKRVVSSSVCGLVDIRPDWIRVMRVRAEVKKEVDEYKTFAKKESRDLREYKRLKEKFE